MPIKEKALLATLYYSIKAIHHTWSSQCSTLSQICKEKRKRVPVDM